MTSVKFKTITAYELEGGQAFWLDECDAGRDERSFRAVNKDSIAGDKVKDGRRGVLALTPAGYLTLFDVPMPVIVKE